MECLRETNRERNRDRVRLEVDSIVETEREKAKSDIYILTAKKLPTPPTTKT